MTELTSPVLVLDRHWSAIRVVPGWRALGYIVRGIAEAIDTDTSGFPGHDIKSWEELSTLRAQYEPESHRFVKTIRSRLVVPAVVRLTSRRSASARHRRVRFNRRNIYARDGNICQYCGKKFKTEDLNLDHVLPRARGGRSYWDNIVCSCIACNTKKGCRTPVEAGMTLIRQPKALPFPADVAPLPHKSWQHFVDQAYWMVELES